VQRSGKNQGEKEKKKKKKNNQKTNYRKKIHTEKEGRLRGGEVLYTRVGT